MDLTLYWFMFPVSIGVATTAMMSGVGGAALFMPIFLIVFPLLGPEYQLASPVAAIGVALLIETFGFSSGFVGYYRKHLIDFRQARGFLVFAVPAGVTGALISHLVNATMLQAGYGLLMLILSVIFLRGHDGAATGGKHAEKPARAGEARRITARDSHVYDYHLYKLGKRGAASTGLGGFLTGMLSVGIGEVVMPQLVKRAVSPCRLPQRPRFS